MKNYRIVSKVDQKGKIKLILISPLFTSSQITYENKVDRRTNKMEKVAQKRSTGGGSKYTIL